MKRDPSLHITLSNLIKVLDKIGVDDAEHTAMQIMKAAVPFGIKDRYIVKTNGTVKKKVEKRMQSVNYQISVEKFNQILMDERMLLKHNAKPIYKGDAQYPLLMDIAKLVCRFCEECEINNVEAGARIFVKSGLRFMQYARTYGLNKFKYYYDKIVTRYESTRLVDNDSNKEATEECYNIYQALIAEHGGISYEANSDEEYSFFVITRMEADKNKATYENWITAQFEGLSFTNTLPQPNMLCSDAATTRYVNYAFKHKLQAKKKEIKYSEAKDDFEARYAEALKKKNKE